MVVRRGFLKILGVGAAAPAVLPAAAAASAAESALGLGGAAGAIYGGEAMKRAASMLPWYKDPIAIGKAIIKRKWIASTMPEWYSDNKSYDYAHERAEANVNCMRSWSSSTKARVINERRKKIELEDWVKSPSRMLARRLVEDKHPDMGTNDDLGPPW